MAISYGFSPKDYEFPRLYVTEEESSEYIFLCPEKGCYSKTPSEKCKGVRAGLMPYEAGWSKIFDPLKAIITRTFALVIPWKEHKALYIEEGLKVKLVEVSGAQVNFIAREGDEIDERSVLSYVVTGKGETRTVKAGVKGTVIYVAWEPASVPERYIYLIAEDPIKYLKPDCS